MALGVPIGDKSFTELKVPFWINLNEKLEDEFFGSLFGAELGVPKVHIEKNRLDLFSFGITGTEALAKNRIEFLTSISNYLNKKSINTGKISINDHKKQNRKGESTKIYRLLISTEFENVTNFMTLTKMNYCKYKREKLANTMDQFSEIKRNKFQNLLDKGYNEERIMKTLNLTPASLEIINNFEDFGEVCTN